MPVHPSKKKNYVLSYSNYYTVKMKSNHNSQGVPSVGRPLESNHHSKGVTGE